MLDSKLLKRYKLNVKEIREHSRQDRIRNLERK